MPLPILFSQPGCQPCVATGRKFSKHDIEIEVHNIRDLQKFPEALAQVQAMGYNGTPVVLLPDGTHWQGYKPDLIEAYANQ